MSWRWSTSRQPILRPLHFTRKVALFYLRPPNLWRTLWRAHFVFGLCWSEWQDLNLRPPRPERGALPDCATLRLTRRFYSVGPPCPQGGAGGVVWGPAWSP